MADPQRSGFVDKDIEQAITSLKKGAHLLKYGRRGKPKFCSFRLSSDESVLIWYSGKEERQLKLSSVSKIIPGQRTATFQRYPQPEKEYQSFSLIYNDRSLDLMCKDKDEAEVWFVGLKALVTQGSNHRWSLDPRCDSLYSDIPQARLQRNTPAVTPYNPGDSKGFAFGNYSQSRLGKAFSDIISYTATGKISRQVESVISSSFSSGSLDTSSNRTSAAEAVRVSSSSAVSSSSHGSNCDDFDAFGDIFIWGEGIGDGILGGGMHRVRTLSTSEIDAFLPKALESKVVLDVHSIACGYKHAALVTKQGEIFSWGEESGGRLGHGVEADVSCPKLIETLGGMNIESIACGEYHTCAVTSSGDLYTWGDGTHNSGLLGHGTEVSHWIPKKVSGDMEGVHVSYVSCGPWHTAIVTSAGQLFTFGDGSFGTLGHGDHSSTYIPREVETLRGMRTSRVSCGVWHTAAVVEAANESIKSSGGPPSGKLFTWGDGDKGQLGHGDMELRLLPECVTTLEDENICQVACAHNLTIVLTTSGQVYTMGSTAYGQLGNPAAVGNIPTRVGGKITDSFIEGIACGSYHVAVLTSRTEVYTWGKGANGQLGHGDNYDRNIPTLVEFLKDKQVKSVACGSNFTAIVCLHKWLSGTNHSVCSGCNNPFGFRRKRHNCYNCGLVFCKACRSRKSIKAALAPNANKPYRVCDDCHFKLKKVTELVSLVQSPDSKRQSMQDSKASKLLGTLSRMSSFGSFIRAESKNLKRPELHNNHVFLALNGKPQLEGVTSLKVSTFTGTSRKLLSVSVPSTGVASRATSPASSRSSPRLSSDNIHDGLKLRNDIPTQEVAILKAQVEHLTRKSKRLESELERTSMQLKEVTAIATDEAERCKSAKEVIKSLTNQLKQIVQRGPEGHNANSSAESCTGTTTNIPNHSLNDSHITDIITAESESASNAPSQALPNGTKAQGSMAEWVVQEEPGVYLSLSTSPAGHTELKRVRFSRRYFTEEQAERWWSENENKVLERHNIVTS